MEAPVLTTVGPLVAPSRVAPTGDASTSRPEATVVSPAYVLFPVPFKVMGDDPPVVSDPAAAPSAMTFTKNTPPALLAMSVLLFARVTLLPGRLNEKLWSWM